MASIKGKRTSFHNYSTNFCGLSARGEEMSRRGDMVIGIGRHGDAGTRRITKHLKFQIANFKLKKRTEELAECARLDEPVASPRGEPSARQGVRNGKS